MIDVTQTWQATPLPWQQLAFEQLLAMRDEGRLPHALMLTGGKGSGKAVFAAALSAALLCRTPTETGACGGCEGCQLALGGGHGDYRWLAPEEGKRAIGIDAVRETIRFVQQTSGYGDVKVLVINPAEAMTVAAANALLKTLEEPAGNSHLILVSHRPGDLPATVRSRCQSIVLPGPTRTEALGWLVAGLSLDEMSCRAGLEAANGQVMAAWGLLSEGLADERLTLRDRLMSLMSGGVAPGAAAAELGRFELELVLETSLSQLESWMRAQDGTTLRQTTAVFGCHAQVQQWLAATRRGLNLSRDQLLRQLCRELAGVVTGTC